MVQLVNPWLCMPTSYLTGLVLANPSLAQPSTIVLWEATDDGLSVWVPGAQMRDTEGVQAPDFSLSQP